MHPHNLVVDEISKSFWHQGGLNLAVLDCISFEVNRGEILCLLGPSGCGKTTLLNIVAGLDLSDSGKVSLSWGGSGKPRIGYMFQTDGLLAWRTVEKNVTLGLEMGRHVSLMSSTNGGALSLLAEFGLTQFAKSYPFQLSGGMRQKVALARTLAIKPEIMLLDEPLAHLDVLSRLRIGELLRSYVEHEGALAIIVSHSVEDALAIGHRIIVLAGTPARVSARFNPLDLSDESGDRVSQSLFDKINSTLKGLAGKKDEQTSRR